MSRIVIDRELRGCVTPSVLARIERAGLHVHRVGRAAYIHDDAGVHRWLLVVSPAPPLAERLAAYHRWLLGRGPAPAIEARREAAWLDRRRHQRLPWWAVADAAGRLLVPRHLQPWRLS